MTRFILFPSSPRAILGTSNGDDEVYLFSLEPARDPWHTARLSVPATCHCRPADNMLLATSGARQRVSEYEGSAGRAPLRNSGGLAENRLL